MVSSFLARQDPAGRELKPKDLSLPNVSPISGAEKPSVNLSDLVPRDVPPADSDPAAGGDPNSTPTTPALSPDVPTTTVIPDPSPDLNNPQLTTADTPGQDTPPPEPIADSNQGPKQDRLSSSNPGDGGPTPDSGSSNTGAQGDVLAPPLQSEVGYIPSTVSNDPQPTTTQTISDPPVSSTLTLSTGILQAAPTAPSTQEGALSSDLSNDEKYIIGGAVGGGVFILILLVLLLVCCCRKRRAKRDLERGDGHPRGKADHGQFSCCDHGTCRNHGQTSMEQRTPLRPFALKSEPVVVITKQPPQHHTVSFNRRDSTGSQKSAGSDAGSGESDYSDGSSQRGKKGVLKRPPPLKLTSLVTPVINGPQDNPRDKTQRPTLQNPLEVPTIVVEPPRSRTPDGMRRR